jgi:outer membrane lipoprotein-sorting protein
MLWILSGWLVCCAAPAASADPVSELLAKLEQRRERARSLQHTTRTVSRDGDVVREATSRLWELRTGGAHKVRLATTVETSRKGGRSLSRVDTVTVFDGTHEWRQMPVDDQVMVIKAKASSRKGLDDVRAMMKAGNPRMKGRENIHQEPCVVLEVLGGGRNDRFRATYWISESYGVVLKSSISRADRSATEMETVSLKVDEPIEDGIFVYKPPEGATVLDTGALGKQPAGAKP